MWIYIVIAIVVLISLLVILLMYRCAHSLDVTEYNVYSEKIPVEFDGFIICQISDFHNTTSDVITSKLIDAINSSKPDIIVITGDLVDYYNEKTEISIEFLKRIISVAPIYYISGNHEARIDDYTSFNEQLESIGVTVLDNNKAEISRNYGEMEIIGLKDKYFYADIEPRYLRDEIISQNLSSLVTDNGSFKILLSHMPEIFDIYSSVGVDLVFSGHAHGGQIIIPKLGGLFSPSQGLFPKLTSGLHKRENTQMIISRGIGNNHFPYRINNNPELVIAKLISSKKQE